MKPTPFAHQIIELKKRDLNLRKELINQGILSKGYHQEMEALHIRNARELDAIMEQIGYPTMDKVGKEANEAAWLVIQHAISLPKFMRKCAKYLQEAVQKGKDSPIHLAYLTDRIAVFEGRLQFYGTQFDWDEYGMLNPQPYDDLEKVNQRRQSIGLNTLEAQLRIIRQRAELEQETPPTNYQERQQQYLEWRKQVGWVK